MLQWLWTFLLDCQHSSWRWAFLDQCPNNIFHAGSPPQCHGVTGSSSRWHGTSRGTVQLKNNPSLLFEAQGVYHDNLLWLCNICSPLTTWRRVFPSRRGKTWRETSMKKKTQFQELHELIVACQSSSMLNEFAKFMTVEGRSWAGAFG